MSFAFDNIRLRNGRVYDFTGAIVSVRTPNNDSVRVDTEGVVQDDTGQTGRTVTRTGIGAAIGAVIGAIAGGGQGAAIGGGGRRRRRRRVGLHPGPERSRSRERHGVQDSSKRPSLRNGGDEAH